MFWNKAKIQQRAVLYINRNGDTAICVPLFYNGKGGFLYEDVEPVVLSPIDNAELIGEALLRSLRLSMEKKIDTSELKGRNWPAFKVSGCRTQKQFEKDFIRMHIKGANDANIIYSIEGSPCYENELKVVASSNPIPMQLGEKCLKVYSSCISRTF